MKNLLLAVAAVIALAGPALAIDPSPEAISNTTKSGKPLHVSDVTALMRQSEIWCYREEGGTCDWSEIYLSSALGPEGVVYESSTAWNSETDAIFVDKAQFEGNVLCEYGYDKVPSTRGMSRVGGEPLFGRALDALRGEVYANQNNDSKNCFDYVYASYDGGKQTMDLRQRQYVNGVIDPAREAIIKVHFNAADIAGLSQRDD